MPAILLWLVNVFSTLVVFLGQYFLVSTAKVVAITTVYIGLVLAFTLAIDVSLLVFCRFCRRRAGINLVHL